jgi:ABC-2 type transport system permease protein
MSTNAMTINPLRGIALAARLHYRTFFRGSRLWSGPALLLLPILFTLLSVTQGYQLAFFEQGIAPNTLFGGLALLVPLLYAGSAWSEEVERKTITYLLLRPTPRYALYLGKVLCSSLVSCGLFLIAELLCFGIIATTYSAELLALRLQDLAHHCAAIFFAALAYGALFSFIGVLLPKFSLMVSIAYGALIEVLLPALPVSFRYITIQHNVRVIARVELVPDWTNAILYLGLYTVIFLGLGALLASKRDYTFGD